MANSIAHISTTEPAIYLWLTSSWYCDRDAKTPQGPGALAFVTLSTCATWTRPAPTSRSGPCAIFAHRVPAGDVAAHESLVKVWPSLGTVAPMCMRPPSKVCDQLEFLAKLKRRLHLLWPDYIHSCDLLRHSSICRSFVTHILWFWMYQHTER